MNYGNQIALPEISLNTQDASSYTPSTTGTRAHHLELVTYPATSSLEQ
jgi:hypothetical protein